MAFAAVAAFQRPASAAVEIKFPTDGFYRPGKYFPVQIIVRGEPAGMLRMGANGAVATELPVGVHDQTVIVPMLAISSALVDLHVFPPSGHAPGNVPNLIALTDEDRLVAMVGDETVAAQMLFGGKNIWPIQFDPSGPLLEPMTAWQSLDGVILDTTTASRMTQRQLAGLLAAGTVVAINGGNRPTGPWRLQWKKVGTLWVASRPEAGVDDIMQPDAYLPSQGWQPQFDGALRWRVFIMAAVLSAVLIGLLLLQPRGMTLVGVAIALLAAGGAVFWHSRQVTTQARYGSVYIRGGLAVLRDQWSYHAVIRPETVAVPFDQRALLRPIFGYDRQPADTQIHLQCDERGNPLRFIYRQQPHTMIAFMSRTIEPGFGDFSLINPVDSRLLPVAEYVEQNPGDQVAGMVATAPGEYWPAVVITATGRTFDTQQP